MGGILEALAKALPEEEEDIMTTIAEHLRQEGMQQGRQEGTQQGRQEGMQQGKFAVARAMQAKGLDKSTILELTGLSRTDLELT